MGVACPVSEILLLSKMVNFSFPWSSKILIDWNQLKKFMLVGVNVSYMNTNFGGCSLSGFRDIATFKNGQFFLSVHVCPWSSKILIDWNQLKKFMLVGIDVKCMHTNFGGHSLSSFGDIATLKNSEIFPFRSPWSSKNLIYWNRL